MHPFGMFLFDYFQSNWTCCQNFAYLDLPEWFFMPHLLNPAYNANNARMSYFHTLLFIMSTLWWYMISSISGWHRVRSLRWLEMSTFRWNKPANKSLIINSSLSYSWEARLPRWAMRKLMQHNKCANFKGKQALFWVSVSLQQWQDPQHDSWQTDAYSWD